MKYVLPLALLLAAPVGSALGADVIVYNGKIVTVDPKFSIHEAMAIEGNRIVKVGTSKAVMALKKEGTNAIDLGGRMVLPGLMDSHVHPSGASMHEWDHPVPEMDGIKEVLEYIKGRTKVVPKGNWIVVRQVFITRLKEQRYPTRAELDSVAPNHPVLYSTGPDASLNTPALKESRIDKDFKVTDGGSGYAEKDPKTGEPTGILRSCTRYVKASTSGRKATDLDRTEQLLKLFKDYNSVGLTAVIDRNASASAIRRYQKIRDNGKLTVRLGVSHGIGTRSPTERIIQSIQKVAKHPLRKKDPLLRIVGIKTFLDGGMLTGSAYMRKPWGLSKIYSITDPKYRGLLYIPKAKLNAIVKAAVESGLQFTAHSVGDGAVHALLDAYEAVNKEVPVGPTRPCLTHSNFMSREAVDQCAKLGVVVDIQPAWLYLDAHTLEKQFGYKRLRYFQPLKSLFEAGVIVGGGSDHMQKIGSLRSVNPYNPFLGMWVAITRKGKRYKGQLHPEEALTREQAIRFYTMNNAHLLFMEKEVGSLESGKLADFIVLDRDLLTCPVDKIRGTKVLQTWINGKRAYLAKGKD